MVLGLIALMDNQYQIRSNRESGDGRYDICLIPRNQKYPGILMELKAERSVREDVLELLAANALKQIGDRRYHMEMENQGVHRILCLGIAFSGKRVVIKAERGL